MKKDISGMLKGVYTDEIKRMQSLYNVFKNKNIIPYIESIKKDIAKIEEKEILLNEYIKNIPDPLTRNIFELRFLHNKTFKQIADELYYSQRYIQEKYSRQLKKDPLNIM